MTLFVAWYVRGDGMMNVDGEDAVAAFDNVEAAKNYTHRRDACMFVSRETLGQPFVGWANRV